jgi:cytochrome P450
LTPPRFVPDTITPPSVPYGPLRGAMVLARNPLEWFPQKLYEGRPHVFRRGGRTFVVVADPVDAETILLKRAECFQRSYIAEFTLKPALGTGLLTADGESWRTQRRIAAPAFRPANLAALAPVMGEAAAAGAARLAAQPGLVDVTQETTRITFEVIRRTVFGDLGAAVDPDSVARDLALYLDKVGNPDVLDLFGAPRWIPHPWKRSGLKAAGRMRALAAATLAEKRRAGALGDDIASLLIAARDPDTGAPMPDERIVDNLITFIAAGHETTSLALTWTLSILAHLPHLQDALAAEAAAVAGDGPVSADDVERLALHRRVLMEAMRLFPPAPAIIRNVVAEVEVAGVRLGPGDHASVAIYPMHRRRDLWPDADAFDPDRFLPDGPARHRFAWLPFGGGPRVCIGQGFAMMEAAIILAALVRAVRVAPGGGPRVRPVQRVTLRPAGGMPLRVERR